MPTRKEALQDLTDEVERLSDALACSGQEVRHAGDSRVDGLDTALRRHADDQRTAAREVSTAIRGASSDLVGAAIVHTVGGVATAITHAVLDVLKEHRAAASEHLTYQGERSQLLNSIRSLQEKYPKLTYDFIIQRGYVSRTTRNQRQSILNGLIHDDLVTTNISESGEESFSVDDDNPAVIEHWEQMDELLRYYKGLPQIESEESDEDQ